MTTPDTPSPLEAEDLKPEAAAPAEAHEASSAEDASATPAEAESAPEGTPAAPKRRWATIALDAALVLLLLAILAAAGYYFHATTQRYHVPTPAELLAAEGAELDKRYNELLPKAQHADTQLHMRARLAQLDGQLARYSSQLAEKKAAIEEQKGQTLALQYAIRQADATNRKVARSLLPGMPVGTVTTTKGDAFREATFFRVSKRHVDVRFPGGQVRVPMRELVKDNLPKLARYAFGELELVDMSDFELTGAADAPAPEAAKPAKRQAKPRQGRIEVSYDPAPGAPVLDTNANQHTTSRVPEGESAEVESWDAPSGELPM